MSRITRSGDRSAIAVFASAPLPHSPTISMSSSSRSSDTIRARAIGSSSATTVRIFTSRGPSRGPRRAVYARWGGSVDHLGSAAVHGERNGDLHAESALDVGKDEFVPVCIQVLKARPRVGEADTAVEEREPITRNAESGVVNRDRQAIAN